MGFNEMGNQILEVVARLRAAQIELSAQLATAGTTLIKFRMAASALWEDIARERNRLLREEHGGE